MQKYRKQILLLVDAGVYFLVRLLTCVAQALPPRFAESFARGFSVVMTYIIPVRRRLVFANLRRAFPEITLQQQRHITRKMWEHLALMGIEATLARRKIHERNRWQYVTLEHIQPLLAQLNRPRPTIVVTGHFGNFEMGGFLLGVMGYPSYSVARTLDNPFLQKYIQEIRESTGQFLISKNEGYAEILQVLERHGTMAFLVDQAAWKRGYRVSFFGHPASTYKAIAILAFQFQAPMAVCTATRERGKFMRFRLTSSEIIDPQKLPESLATPFDLTQWYTHKLEEQIRVHPDQYWWLHKRWK